MNLSVIIPSKKLENLVPCIEAVRRHEPTLRCIVVDDGLDLARIARREECWCCANDPIEIVGGALPFIYSRNCNIGIQAAGRDDVILLNDDALLTIPGGFSKLQHQWLTHQEYGLIGSSMNQCGNPNQNQRPGARLREEQVMVVFACVFVPRLTMDRMGLLDERFGLNAGGAGPRGYGCDDDDYSWRVRQAGLKLGIYDGCYVDHGSLTSTFRGDPEHPANVVLHERLFRAKWGRSPRNP